MIVDDGSTDNTDKLVSEWQDKNHFSLIYKKIPHSGRNAAVNAAASLISGDFVTVLDSDDQFVDDAFAIIYSVLRAYDFEFKNGQRLCAIGFMQIDERGNLMCSSGITDPIRCSYLYGRFVHRIRGEIAYVWTKSCFIELKFQELPPPNHVTPSVAYSKHLKSYDIIYTRHVINYLYRHDGIPRITKGWSVPTSYSSYLNSKSALCDELDYFWHDPKYFRTRAYDLIRRGLLCHISLREQYESLETLRARLLWIFALPIGLKKYLRSAYRLRRTGTTKR